MGRAPCCDKASVKKGPWAPEEDAVLKAYVDAHGTGGNWIALPHKIGLNRCGKSCRLRWLNYLRPNIRHGGFTEEEDRLICSLYITIGSRWSTIAAQLPGRTDNDVKNYWNTKLKRRLLGVGPRPRGTPQPRLLLESPTGGGAATSHSSLAASALERMQLSMQLQRRHGGRLHETPSFTFYNNLAAPPWQNQPSLSPAASDNSAETMQLRHLSSSTTTGYSGFWSHIQGSSSYTGVGVQEGTWDSTSTPPLSASTGETTAGVESSSSTPTASSAVFGNMEDEIDMLLQQIRCFRENDDQIGDEAAPAINDHFFRATIDETVVDGSVGSWSSSSSTPGVDAVFQDYVQGYRQ